MPAPGIDNDRRKLETPEVPPLSAMGGSGKLASFEQNI
jgi:hypothetical protein